MSSTKKPSDTDIHGPTFRPGDPDRDSSTPPSPDRDVVEGDDIPATGEGATREKLGDYLSSLTSVNKYRPSAGLSLIHI